MSAATQLDPRLMTIEEFARRPDSGHFEELVRGRVVRVASPKPYHGFIRVNIGVLLSGYARANDLGYVMSNDSGVITERDPDTLRGADVCFYSYARVPKGSLARDAYLEVPPDVVFEVFSPSDRWPKVLAKVAEYLEVGVPVVCVLDPADRALHLYTPEGPSRRVGEGDELILSGALEGFRIAVGRFFD